jgi:lysozyme
MSIHTPGIDVSTWQDATSTPQHMDFSKSVAMGAKFVFIKASHSTALDEDFLINWKNAKDAGIIRGAYHYLDWSKPAIEQARFFAGLLKQDPGELPPVLDFENRTNVPSPVSTILACKTFLVEAERLIQRKLIIYTSPYFWREFGATDVLFEQYPLWIAHYTTAADPIVPLPWKSWTFWQWTDRGDGLAYGAESKSLDMNWFNGSYEDLLKFADITTPPPPPPPRELTLKELSDMHTGVTKHP